MQPAPERRSPVELPGPEGDNTIAREPLWYAYAHGDDRPAAPAWTYTSEPPPETHTAPPSVPVRNEPALTLPRGTADLLGRTPYPHGRAAVEVYEEEER
ncbi:hypothetical protein ACFQZU_23720, partial [Streptomonospora algeriensis]